MRKTLFFVLLILLVLPAFGRGKNKIPYEHFDWKVYQSPHFDIFYYEEEAHLLEGVADLAEAAYEANSKTIQHEVEFRIPLVIFKSHEEFEQTNIFPGFLPKYVGAFAEPFQSRMVLPVDLPPEELYELLRHEMTHIFQYDMLFNNKISTIMRANAPTWLIEGMASYVADDEDNFARMVLRDAAINSNFRTLAQFSGQSYLAYRVGHAAFDFMEQEWGIEGIRNFLWEYRKNITGKVESAMEKAFELSPEEFSRKFRKYLRKRYVDLLPIKEEPDDHAREIRTRKVFTTLSPELSVSGDLFAAMVPIKNELDLVLVSTKDGRIFKNLTKGYTNRYTDMSVSAFDGINDLAWSPDGNQIVFIARKEGTNVMFVVNVLNGDLMEELRFDDVKEIQSPAFGADSDVLFFSGNQDGVYDLYEYSRSKETLRNLTSDPEEDRNPRISPDGKELVYSSNRDGFFKIFSLDLDTGKNTQLTSGLGNDIQPSYSQDMKSVYFSSDRFDDIYNIYGLDLETGRKAQYTNVLTGAFAPQERIVFDHREGEETKQLVFTSYYEGRFRIYRMDNPEERKEAYDVSEDNYQNVKEHVMTTNLTLDPEKFKPYKMTENFTVSGVDLTAGVTDDGRFLTNSRVSFGDVLGNHSVDVYAYSISSYESYYVNYLNRTRRLQWGTSFDAFQYFFVDYYNPVNYGQRLDRVAKDLRLTGYMRYPFSLFSRVDFGVGATDQDTYRPLAVYDDNNDVFLGYTYEQVDFTAPFAYVALSRDTIRYANFGPMQGMGFDFIYSNAIGEYQTFSTDFRAYKELTRRSLLAFRVRGDYSDGDTPELFYLGGNNNLRGDYYYNQFSGTRRVLTQMELRFPLIDYLGFPGFGFGNIRGAFFAEAGGTWSEDGEFSFEFEPDEEFDPATPSPKYLLGTYGFDVSMFLFGLELHWNWAKRTNFSTFPSSSNFSFWIGRTF